jgi:hypothetical protein
MINFAAQWTDFLWQRLPALWICSVFGSDALLDGLVFKHLAWASTLSRRSRSWAALALAAAVVGTGVIAEYAGRDAFSTVMDYSAVVKPVDARWVPAASLEQFFQSSEQVKKDLDSLARKAASAQP